MNLPDFLLTLVQYLLALHSVQQPSWPYGPFYSSGRWIVNTRGDQVTYAGVNWPGAGETMIPEGLQYQSIATIVSKIKSLEMNVIRLTFAIEMIDDILDHGSDVTIKDSFINALGATYGNHLFERIVAKNPQFNAMTTRLEVFDAIAAECFRQQIYVHLDNHVSKAQWCCWITDGNGWFGDQFFDVAKWQRGLKYMAMHGAKWGNLMSIGMRNELRDSGSPTYGWSTWYTYMVAAANEIYNVNPEILLFFSGLNYDTTLSAIPSGDPLGDGKVFHKTDFAFQDKIVLELHKYDGSEASCTGLKTWLDYAGFNSLMDSVENQLPMVMTEWGHYQDEGGSNTVYASCLREYLPERKAGWMVWVIAGSYYIRSEAMDLDETWGLLNHDWSDWRSAIVIENGIRPMVKATLASNWIESTIGRAVGHSVS